MNILILIKKIEGGVGSATDGICKELEKKGHHIKIISREDNLKIYSLFYSLFKIRDIIKDDGKSYDIIYTQDWSMALPLIFPSRLVKNKHYSCFHGRERNIFSSIIQKIVGKILGKRLIVVGDSLKKIFPKSSLIYNGVDTLKFKPSKKEYAKKNSLGFSNWATEEYHFHKIEEAAKELGKNLIVAKGRPHNEMPKFYNKVETFISLPPNYTGFNLVWVEAMASGVKKIVGNNAGIGKNLPITKIEDYKNDIKEAIINAKSRDYRKWVIKNKFTLKDAAKKIEKIFENES